jgi:hypothetical protein
MKNNVLPVVLGADDNAPLPAWSKVLYGIIQEIAEDLLQGGAVRYTVSGSGSTMTWIWRLSSGCAREFRIPCTKTVVWSGSIQPAPANA